MKKNVGDLDRHIRLTCGLFMLGHGIAKDSSLWIGLGAMKVAEGISRYCPILDLFDISTVEPRQRAMHKVKRAVRHFAEDL